MRVPFCVPSDHRVVATRQWGRVHGLTLEPEGCNGGRREFLFFKPGFYVAMGHVEHHADRLDLYPSGDFFKLHFRMSGHSRVGQADTTHSQRVLPLTMSTLVQSRNSYKEEHFTAGERERSLTICCSRDFLRDELGVDHVDEWDALLFPGTGDTRDFRLRQVPMGPQQIELVDALLDVSVSAPHRGLLVESRAGTLLHGFLCGIGQPEQTYTGSETSGSVDGLRMSRLARHLNAHLGDAIDLGALALDHGMTVRRLAKAFKQVHGKTVSEYLCEARLHRARHMLESGCSSVTNVAFAVGYGHVANFSTAFKRAFGVSPLMTRQKTRGAVQELARLSI